MKKYLLYTALLVFIACRVNSQVKTFSVSEFEAALQAGQPQLLDVRTAAEFKGGHLSNALQADWLDKKQFAERIQYLDKSRPVLVYCASGVRSGDAAKWLYERGFTQVANLKGGTSAWKLAGKPMDAAAAVAQMSRAAFQEAITAANIVLVDVGAEWCPPCKKMEPVLAQLARDMKGKFNLFKVDGGNDTDIMQLIKAESLPTFIVYKEGKEIWRKQGLVSLEELKKALGGRY